MSTTIRGFNVDGNVYKYDYDGLENISVQTGHIAASAVTADKVASNAITTGKIVDGAVTADKIASNAITTAKIVDGAVTADKIASNAITTGKIANYAVTTDKIAAASVTSTKLAAGAAVESIRQGEITSDLIGEGEIKTDNIAFGAVTTDKIDQGAVGSMQLDFDAVGTEAIQDRAVTIAKLNSEVLNQISSKVSKEAVRNSGIYEENYTTIFDTATATTAMHEMDYPWALLSSNEDVININNVYRVTFDGAAYIIPYEMWFSRSHVGKNWTLVGNATLLGSIMNDGFCGDKHEDLPFLITGGVDTNNDHIEGLYLITETVGTHTVKIEKIIYTFTRLPHQLINGFPKEAVNMVCNGTASYNGYSMGENEMINKRATFAIGYGNILNGDSTFAVGGHNSVTGSRAMAFGKHNTCSGNDSFVFGLGNTVSGKNAVAIGQANTASGLNSCAVGGSGNMASGSAATAMGYMTKATGNFATSINAGTEAAGQASTAMGIYTKATHMAQLVYGEFNALDSSANAANQNGTYVEIVGNGTNENNRSNARTLDWEGNESLAGGLTLGKGTSDETTITAAQLKRLLALLS